MGRPPKKGEAESEPLFGPPRKATSPPPHRSQESDADTDSQRLIELGAEAVAGIARRQVAKQLGAPRQLPFSKQFTPAQVPSLNLFLSAITGAAGDKERVQGAVFRLLHPVADRDRDSQKWTMAYNAVLSAHYYGLVTKRLDALTPFGAALMSVTHEEALAASFAQHILRNLNGLELVEGIAALARAGQQPHKMALARYFAERGLASNADGTDINGMAGWLQAAGVYAGSGWYVLDETRLQQLSGIGIQTIRDASKLSAESLAILEQLALAPGHTSTTGEMVRLLKMRTDLRIDVAGFKKTHLDPLAAAGLLSVEKVTGGRGGAATRLTGTDLFRQEVVQRLLDQIRQYGIAVSGPDLELPFSALVARLRDMSLSRDERGRALELFALRLLRRLGLTNIRLRTRPAGAEEIDATAEGFAPVHARWQVQCKNSKTLDVDHAAKEVGVAVRNRSTVIVLLTTGTFTQPAAGYVDEVVRFTPFTIVRLDGADVDTLARDETKIVDLLSREAERARTLRSAVSDALPIASTDLTQGAQ